MHHYLLTYVSGRHIDLIFDCNFFHHSTTVATLANATFIRFGWYYDGKGNIDVFVNDAKVCSVDVGVSTGTMVSTFPNATNLGIGFGCKAASTAPTTADMIVDFMMSAQTRAY